MTFDKEINQALVLNLRLKSKILAIIFGAIFIVQILSITYFYFNTLLFEGILSVTMAIFGPGMILIAFLIEFFSFKYFTQSLKTNEAISKKVAYSITFIEITFPSLIILFAGEFLQDGLFITTIQLFNSPPAFIYFIMILLSALMLDFRLSVFAGLLAGIQFISLTFFFFFNSETASEFEIPNNLLRGILMIVSGIIAGLVSKKIKEAVLASLRSKNDLIHKLDILVEEKTTEVVLQKEEIEQKNKDITDSINYARRIQHSLLPKSDLVDKIFDDYFVLYQPKDIVSGDFYWATKKNGKKIIAAVDCTGHGVPGAFMSMVGISLLNEIVNENQITNSSEILYLLRERLIKTLQQTGAEGESRDGMDIALCVIDDNELEFSGANNPLYLIRNNELTEYKGDKHPIGIYSGISKPFTSTKIALQKNDSFYIFTDGFADQFGGTVGKKFMNKRLKRILVETQSHSLSQQKKILEQTFFEWKSSNEQVDDVLIIGIRI